MKNFLLLLILFITQLVNAQTVLKPTSLIIGKNTDVDMTYVVDRAGTSDPFLKWSATSGKWCFSNNAVSCGEMVDKVYVDTAVAGATIPDADATTKGKIQLAGDLSGTAAAPTVPALTLKAPLASPALTGVPTAPTATPLTNTTQIATTAYVDSAVSSSTIPDATTSVKGKVQLAGDLAGTAAAPTVPGLALKAPIASPTFTGTPAAPTATAGTNTTQVATTAFVTSAVASATPADATTSTKGIVQLAGDLAGTAASPTVPGLALKAPIASPTFTGVPVAPTATAGTNTTQLATTAFVTNAVTSSTAPDATTSTKGIVQLAGDLAGTATSPTVPGLALKAPLASPALTGNPTAPTATVGDNDTSVATTAFVSTAVTNATDPTKISGPASSQDNGLVRFDGTTGKLAQDSVITVSDTGTVASTSGNNLTLSTANTTDSVQVVRNIRHQALVADNLSNDTATGDNQTLSAPTTKVVRLTGSLLKSIDGIPAGIVGQELVVVNQTLGNVIFNNETGATTANRIVTGTNASIKVRNNGAIRLVYDTVTARWHVTAGVSGTAGIGSPDIAYLQDFEGSVLTDFTTTGTGTIITLGSPIHGDTSIKLTHQGAAGTANTFKQSFSISPKFAGVNLTMKFDCTSTASYGNLTLTVRDETNAVDLIPSEVISCPDPNSTAFSTSDSYTVTFDTAKTTTTLSYKFTGAPEASDSFSKPRADFIDDLEVKLTKTSLLSTSISYKEATIVDSEWLPCSFSTLAWQGLGTVTNNLQCKRKGADLLMKGTATVAAVAAVAQIPLPIWNGTQLVSKGTSVIPVGQLAGKGNRGAASATTYFGGLTFLINPSVSYINIGCESSSSTGYAAANGSACLGNETFAMEPITIPIEGWTESTTQSVSKTIPLTQSGIVKDADSMVRLDTHNGYGSTGTKIPRFTNMQTNIGDAIFYQDSAVNGSSFTAMKDGVYSFMYTLPSGTSAGTSLGFSKNSSSLSTNVGSLTSAERLAYAYVGSISGTSAASTAQWTGYLVSGDVIRPHTDGVTPTSNLSHMTVTYQGSLRQVNVNKNSKIKIPTSEVRFEGSSTRGSTNTAIVIFDAIAKLRGDAFTINPDGIASTFGTHVRMNKSGRVTVSTSLALNASNANLVISKNQSTLTAVPSLASEVMSSMQTYTITATSSSSATFDVVAGDTIRVSASAAAVASIYNVLNITFQDQDIQVSVSNTLPQFSDADSVIRVQGSNGYGSTSTRIRRWASVLDNRGSDIVYNDSSLGAPSVVGDSFKIVTDGTYTISGSDFAAGIDEAVGVTKNTTEPSVNLGSVTDKTTILTSATVTSAGVNQSYAWTGFLSAGTVVRAHNHFSSNTGSRTDSSFTIAKIGKPNVTGVDVTSFANVPVTDSKHIYVNKVTTISAGVNVTGATTDEKGIDGILSYNSTTGVYTALKPTRVVYSFSGQSTSGGAAQVLLYHNATFKAVAQAAAASQWLSTTLELDLQVNETFNAFVNAGSISQFFTTVNAVSTSDSIVTPTQSFSTDAAYLTFKSSAVTSTDPVGTFSTYSYTASSNTRAVCPTAPTQSVIDMNVNGLFVATRNYASASACGNPAAYSIQIGKNLKGWKTAIYKSTGKSTAGTLRYYVEGAVEYGAYYLDYNETTGILTVDLGTTALSTNTVHNLSFEDNTTQTSGYLVINASKTPTLSGVTGITKYNDKTTGVTNRQNFLFQFGGTGSASAPTTCTVTPCAEYTDPANIVPAQPTRASTGVYQTIFPAASFANSVPVSCDCRAYAASGTAVRCATYNNGNQTLISSSTGGYIIGVATTSTTGTAIDAYVDLECSGQVP